MSSLETTASFAELRLLDISHAASTCTNAEHLPPYLQARGDGVAEEAVFLAAERHGPLDVCGMLQLHLQATSKEGSHLADGNDER